MNGRTTQRRQGTRRGRSFARRALATATVGTMSWLAVGTATAHAATAPAPLAAPTIAQRVEPAVELIETDVSGSITYYDVTLDTNALLAWAQNDPGVQGVASPQDATRLLVKELTAHPGAYLQRGRGTTLQDELVYDGSGFNVTPDGYIVTNAHVATVSKSEAVNGFVHDTLKPAVNTITQSMEQQLASLTWNGTALQVPDDQSQAVQDLVLGYIQATAEVGNISTTVYAGGGPNMSRNLVHKGQVARVVASGDMFPGKDVAILKIEADNLPTVPLGDDTLLQTGDTVYALGYPGDATFDPSIVADTVTAQPTLSNGTVSNRLQSSKANYQYIENTATINHGNSGGALVDAQGHVVGITTASDSSTEQGNGVNGGKFFYAVPISVVNDFLTANHVRPAGSPDQAMYDKAVDLMSQSHYKAALDQLRTARSDGYNSPYLAQQMDRANAAIAAHRDVPLPSGSSSMLPIAGGIGAAVALAAVGFIIAGRRRSGRTAPQPTFPTTMTGATWQPYEPAPTEPVGTVSPVATVAQHSEPAAAWGPMPVSAPASVPASVPASAPAGGNDGFDPRLW